MAVERLLGMADNNEAPVAVVDTGSLTDDKVAAVKEAEEIFKKETPPEPPSLFEHNGENGIYRTFDSNTELDTTTGRWEESDEAPYPAKIGDHEVMVLGKRAFFSGNTAIAPIFRLYYLAGNMPEYGRPISEQESLSGMAETEVALEDRSILNRQPQDQAEVTPSQPSKPLARVYNLISKFHLPFRRAA